MLISRILFLLLFQRETAERALDQISNGTGKEYLQKIVQVGFDLPVPSLESLHEILFKEVNRIFEPIVQDSDWENERWVNLWIRGLSNYFANIRGIYRFLNSFSFMVSAFGRKGTLEVNPVDLIAVECMRVFEPGSILVRWAVMGVLKKEKTVMKRSQSSAPSFAIRNPSA